jgi:type I restriction system adenine methylase HsdM
MMEATARQTVLHNTIYKLKKRLPLSAHDRRKSLYQAVSAHLLTSNSAGAAYLHCIKDGTNIDPACGSGSLLLKFAKILGKENVRLGFFGQEINITTYNLCRINMFLHDIDYDKFDIGHGDTLTNPLHWDDEPFEAIVSNPPYSIKWEGKDNPLLIDDPRFSPQHLSTKLVVGRYAPASRLSRRCIR